LRLPLSAANSRLPLASTFRCDPSDQLELVALPFPSPTAAGHVQSAMFFMQPRLMASIVSHFPRGVSGHFTGRVFLCSSNHAYGLIKPAL
jgi:hypothetical protein